MHRRVCGPGKANPFTWPLLSRTESAELVAHMHETTGTLITADPGRKTVASALCLDAGLFTNDLKVRCAFPRLLVEPHTNLLSLVRRLQYVIECLTVGGHNHVFPLEHQQRMLLSLRAHEDARVTRDPQRPSSAVPISVLNHVANYDMFTARLRAPSDEPEPAWRSRYRHEMLVLIHLAAEARRYLPDSPPRALGDYVGFNRARNLHTMRTTIAATDPRLAESMVRGQLERYALAAQASN